MGLSLEFLERYTCFLVHPSSVQDELIFVGNHDVKRIVCMAILVQVDALNLEGRLHLRDKIRRLFFVVMEVPKANLIVGGNQELVIFIVHDDFFRSDRLELEKQLFVD